MKILTWFSECSWVNKNEALGVSVYVYVCGWGGCLGVGYFPTPLAFEGLAVTALAQLVCGPQII